jgi:hypothetical protein
MRLKLLIIVTSLFFTQLINAQEQADRKGFFFGTSLGIAYSNLYLPNNSDNFTDLGLDLEIGYSLNSKFDLMLTSNVSIYNYTGFGRDRKRDFGILAPTVQYWLIDRLWIQGGVGLGGDNPVFWDIKDPDNDPFEIRYYAGYGAIVAIGYEFFEFNEHINMDIKFRAMYRNVTLQEGMSSGISYGILLGINFR